MHKWIALLALALISTNAFADNTTFKLSSQTVRTGISITVPADAKILTVTATGDNNATLELYLRADSDFNANGNLLNQASYYSGNNSGSASLSIGSYATPALRAGKWYVAVANQSQFQATNVTLSTSVSSSATPDTDFQISFSKPSAALETALGGADKLDCNVGPWTDTSAVGNTTLGAFRQSLLQAALSKLSTQIHTPVPVTIQACWKEFDDSGEHAGSYTLAAATGTYIFYGDPGMPVSDTWYAMAPSERLAGARACDRYQDVDCSIPDIIVWFNSADVAKGNYDGVGNDESLLLSVTMHEITHGLGFLSSLDISESNDDGTDNANFLKLLQGRMDAYTANVGYLKPRIGSPFERDLFTLAELGTDDRKAALTSGQYLVWTDSSLGNNPMNILNANPAPDNLVELHAPSAIQPGSTLSHLAAVHAGQLMTAVISYSHPQTLGLAEPMLERVGWNTGEVSITNTDHPITGNWYDPAHSGHGIDLEQIIRDPAGDQYAVVFYTYDDQGKSEYYFAGARLKNGHLGDFGDPSQPVAMGRPIYDPVNHKATYPGQHGSLAIDFSSDAASDPACAGRSGNVLALMHWSIGVDSQTWCISPLLAPDQHPAAAQDLNGLWNAGPSDSGWGMSIVASNKGDGVFLGPLLYYYDSNNQPRWAQAELNGYQPGQTVNIYDIHGYCRTCAKQPTTHQVIGTLMLNLNQPERSETPSGENTLSANISSFGGPHFHRTNTPMRISSLPSGN